MISLYSIHTQNNIEHWRYSVTYVPLKSSPLVPWQILGCGFRALVLWMCTLARLLKKSSAACTTYRKLRGSCCPRNQPRLWCTHSSQLLQLVAVWHFKISDWSTTVSAECWCAYHVSRSAVCWHRAPGAQDPSSQGPSLPDRVTASPVIGVEPLGFYALKSSFWHHKYWKYKIYEVRVCFNSGVTNKFDVMVQAWINFSSILSLLLKVAFYTATITSTCVITTTC